jgi:hypothetical protein
MAMVDSTLGSSTSTFWKRRSRAASFSMYLRYSSRVVAPMQCSSPRARAGLSMLPASMAPSALPAPTMVCSSSMNRMMRPSSWPTSLSTAFSRSSNSPRYLAPAKQARHVQHQDALALQGLRHLAVDDALGQALDDGGLAHAGFADEHRVVLGAPLQYLDGAADLVVPADHRVQLALARPVGQVQGVLGQGLALAFGFLGVHALAAAHLLDRRFQGLAAGTVLLEQATRLALVVHGGQQEQFAGDVLVAPLGGFLVGQVEQVDQFLGGLDFPAGAFHLGQAVHGVLQGGHQGGQAGAGLLQDGPGGAALLVDQGGQQVHRLDVGVVVAQGQALGVLDGGLERRGEFFETHVLLPIRMIASQMGNPGAISTPRKGGITMAP